MEKGNLKVISLFLIVIASVFFVSVVFGNTHTYYVSSSEGDDNNPGTLSQPFKTIKRVHQELIVDSLLLKRGDVFFESITDLKNCYIGAYGDGDIPVLCGLVLLKPDKTLWKKVSDSIWCIDLRTKLLSIEGYKMTDSPNPHFFYNIGSVYQFNKNKIYGHMVQNLNELLNEGDFYTTSSYRREDIDKTSFGNLYFRWPNNPASLGYVGLTPNNGAIYNLSKCKVENIGIVGFNYGMYYLSYTDVVNCKFDVIGGGIHIGHDRWCRCGNGIELWSGVSPRDHCNIHKCHFSRIYDSGTTIQGVGKTKDMKDILIDSCLFVRCREAFEHYITNKSYSPIYENCRFSDNTCVLMGDNEFGSPRTREANLLSFETEMVNVEISNNTFYGGNHYNARFVSKNMKDNHIYIYDNQYLLCPITGSLYKELIYPTPNGIKEYQNLTGDNSTIHVVERGSVTDKSLRFTLLSGFTYTAPLVGKYLKIIK